MPASEPTGKERIMTHWLREKRNSHPKQELPIPKWAKVLGTCSLLLYPLFCMLIMEYFNDKGLFPTELFHTRMAVQLSEFGPQLCFGLLISYVLFGLLWLLVRKAWIATGLLGSLSLLFGFINYMKLTLKSDPFVPMDIALAGIGKELVSYISVSIPRLFWVALALVLVWSVLLGILGISFPGRWYVRLPAAAAVILAVLVTFSSYDRSTRILNVFHMDLFDNVLQSSNYTANGFVGGFTLNLIGLHIEEPSDYSQATIEGYLEDYTGTATQADAPEYDVIVVLAESFFDLRTLDGVTYSENILENYDSMLASENCYSGNIYTIALGGGTVNTEFRVLTGLNTDNLLPSGATPYTYVNQALSGYVSNYKSAGYNTIGLHLYNPNFYSRKKSYPHLGFDAFYSLSDVESLISVDYTRGYATDASTEAAIEYYMDAAEETGDPTFLFAITIENHQPYQENENNTVTVTADALDETGLLALTTYAQGVKDADAMLGALKEYIDGRERPTVLVWFGDHLPTLGQAHVPYYAMGYYTDDYSVENRMQRFHTPFLVYSNTTLDQGLFTSKSDNQISDIYLMECVAASTGFQQTPYMQYLADAMETLPIYNVELNMDSTLTEEQSEIVSCWKLIAYDRLLGKDYSQ
jgi:phosphoglycerol transferase MdoB-like AlkP superfamily enzyme